MATQFSCSFKKRRIGQSPNPHVLLKRGKSDGHSIILNAQLRKKKLEIYFIKENRATTRFSRFLRKKIKQLPKSYVPLRKKNYAATWFSLGKWKLNKHLISLVLNYKTLKIYFSLHYYYFFIIFCNIVDHEMNIVIWVRSSSCSSIWCFLCKFERNIELCKG